jgi:hypothetical protein
MEIWGIPDDKNLEKLIKVQVTGSYTMMIQMKPIFFAIS